MNWVDSQSEKVSHDGEGFFIQSAIREAFQLRSKLKVSEDFYHQGVWWWKNDARAHFAYGVLDEVLRVSLSMLRWKEIIDWGEIQKNPEGPNDGIERLTYESINFEQKLWCRKLSEHLVSVILFSKYNEQSIYRIWLAGNSLEKTIGRWRDLKEFDVCENRNIRYQIDYLSNDIREEIKRDSLNREELFFIERNAMDFFVDVKNITPPRKIFKSYRQLLIVALTTTQDSTDKLILWPTYDISYGKLSEVIHANDGIGDPNIGLSNIKTDFYRAWMLCTRIIMWLYEIIEIEKTEWAKQLERLFNSDALEAPSLYAKMNRKELGEGDLVFCHNALVEILETMPSKYGHTSFKIKYLGQAPIPEIKIEEVPSRSIQARILTKERAKEYFEREVLGKNPDLPIIQELKSLIWDINNENAYDLLKKVFIDMDGALIEVGWLIRIYANPNPQKIRNGMKNSSPL